jgi:TPR repeat protein
LEVPPDEHRAKSLGGARVACVTAIPTTSQIAYLYNESLKLLQGHGVARVEKRSFTMNAEAANGGHADAVLAMGWLYLNGVGVERDFEKAKRWYREAARRGEPRAMFSLGQIACHERDCSDALSGFTPASEARQEKNRRLVSLVVGS